MRWLELRQFENTELTDALKSMVEAYGKRIYLDKKKLSEVLSNMDLLPGTRSVVLEFSKIPGFMNLLMEQTTPTTAEFERVAYNINDSRHGEKSIVFYLRILISIVASLGLQNEEQVNPTLEKMFSFLIKDEKIVLDNSRYSNEREAKKNYKGDMERQKDWNRYGKAYAYYTYPGAGALGEMEQDRVVSILNQGKFNQSIFFKSTLLALFLLIFGIFSGIRPMYSRNPFLIVIGILLEIAIILAGFVWVKKKPYAQVHIIPFAMFLVWGVWMCLDCFI